MDSDNLPSREAQTFERQKNIVYVVIFAVVVCYNPALLATFKSPYSASGIKFL